MMHALDMQRMHEALREAAKFLTPGSGELLCREADQFAELLVLAGERDAAEDAIREHIAVDKPGTDDEEHCALIAIPIGDARDAAVSRYVHDLVGCGYTPDGPITAQYSVQYSTPDIRRDWVRVQLTENYTVFEDIRALVAREAATTPDKVTIHTVREHRLDRDFAGLQRPQVSIHVLGLGERP